MMKPVWTEEERATLKKLWEEGDLSGSEIGKKMGRNKNSIVGQAHRLGLVKKKSGGSRPGRAKKETPKPKLPALPRSLKQPGKPFVFKAQQVERKPGAYVAPTQIWHGEGVPMLEATHGQCKAVMGSSNDSRGLAIYCGKPIKEGTNLSFCKEHYAQYTTNPYYWRR